MVSWRDLTGVSTVEFAGRKTREVIDHVRKNPVKAAKEALLFAGEVLQHAVVEESFGEDAAMALTIEHQTRLQREAEEAALKQGRSRT